MRKSNEITKYKFFEYKFFILLNSFLFIRIVSTRSSNSFFFRQSSSCLCKWLILIVSIVIFIQLIGYCFRFSTLTNTCFAVSPIIFVYVLSKPEFITPPMIGIRLAKLISPFSPNLVNILKPSFLLISKMAFVLMLPMICWLIFSPKLIPIFFVMSNAEEPVRLRNAKVFTWSSSIE